MEVGSSLSSWRAAYWPQVLLRGGAGQGGWADPRLVESRFLQNRTEPAWPAKREKAMAHFSLIVLSWVQKKTRKETLSCKDLLGSFFSWSGQILHPLQLLRFQNIHVDPFLLRLQWHIVVWVEKQNTDIEKEMQVQSSMSHWLKNNTKVAPWINISNLIAHCDFFRLSRAFLTITQSVA